MAVTPLTGADIITQFELQVSDMTELSTVEELIIANRVYRKVWLKKPWEFAKVSASGGVLSQDATGYYITLPSDFAYFVLNSQYTDNSIGDDETSAPATIYLGAARNRTRIVNFSDRGQYQNHNNVAYLDIANSRIRFLGNPPDVSAYAFDYVKFPDAITLATSPAFPAAFHELIVYGMATQDDILQKSPKASSYAGENQALYNGLLEDMEYWNSQLFMN